MIDLSSYSMSKIRGVEIVSLQKLTKSGLCVLLLCRILFIVLSYSDDARPLS
jgi:hypothetical protein